MKRSIFISHRHEDKAIADALSRELVKWGVKRDWIFQSTHGGSGPRQGRSLRDELVIALADARLVILIYTFDTYNWNYCMYECGVAVDPTGSGISGKRSIILQCTNDVPRVFSDRVLVDVRKEGDVLSLTKTFHQESDLFLDGPFNPDIDEEGLRERGTVLHKNLGEVIPLARFEEIVRWGHLTLRLEHETVEKLEKVIDRKELQEMPTALTDVEVAGATGSVLKHFGYQQHEVDTTLQDLVRRWNALIVDKSGLVTEAMRAVDDAWAEDLMVEIWRTASNMPSSLKWRPLLSVSVDWWVCPVIRGARRHPDGSMEVDFTMYRVPEPRSSELVKNTG